MILPHEKVYKGIGGNTPTGAPRSTPRPNSRKVNPKIQGPPNIRNLKLIPKLPPSLMGTTHQTSRANIEPPTPGTHKPPPIHRGIPQWGL